MKDRLWNGPAVGFEQPFELLGACHERVQQRLDLLQRLDAHLASRGADAQARDAATDLLRYFDRAAPLHHEDEERHVLPRLRATGHADLADRLAQEHRQMLEGWQRLRPALLRVQAGEGAALGPWRDWAALYAAHIAVEEGEAFVQARQGLGEADLAAMGAEMAARRSG
jgi:hemerythrin-like domain-containing protein